MAKYQPVSPRFWQDPKVRRWPDHQKLLGAYLLTCPHRTSEGLFWLPHGYVAQDLGWSIERVSEGYSGLVEAGFCAYDDTSETVLLVKALKYQAPAGEKQVQGAINRLADMPPTPLFSLLRDAAEQYAPDFCKALDEAVVRGVLQHPRYPTDTPPEGYPLARARSSSSNSTSSSEVNTIVDGQAPAQDGVVEQARPNDPVQTVFDAWRDSTGKHRAKLDPKRHKRIKAALRSYALADVLDAVRGWQHSPHHRGENEQGTVYNELDLLLRDAAHIEQFRDLWRHGPPRAIRGKHTGQMLGIARDMAALAPGREVTADDLGGMDRHRPVAQRQLSRPEG